MVGVGLRRAPFEARASRRRSQVRVRLLNDIQGFAVIDGARIEWPGRGGEIDLPDDVALDMIRSQQAIPVTTFQKAEDTVPPTDDEETRVGGAAKIMARSAAAAEAREPLAPRAPKAATIGVQATDNLRTVDSALMVEAGVEPSRTAPPP